MKCQAKISTSYNWYRITLLELLKNHTKDLVLQPFLKNYTVCQLSRGFYKIALIVFKCLYVNDFPSYLKEFISIYSPSRSLRSADKFLLEKPFKNLKTFGHRSFHFSAPQVWNSSPLDIRSCTNLYTFKKKLKTHFFRIAFS